MQINTTLLILAIVNTAASGFVTTIVSDAIKQKETHLKRIGYYILYLLFGLELFVLILIWELFTELFVVIDSKYHFNFWLKYRFTKQYHNISSEKLYSLNNSKMVKQYRAMEVPTKGTLRYLSCLDAINKRNSYPSPTQAFMDDVRQWADNTFGRDRKVTAVLHHLQQEVIEAIEAVEQQNDKEVKAEFADMFILILNASSKYGMRYDELFEAAQIKMAINKSRKWGTADKNGVVNHIKKEA